LRVAALCAASKSGGALPAAGFDFLVGQLSRTDDLRGRLAAAEALGTFDLDAGQLQSAARLVEQATPLEISWLLRSFEDNADSQAGLALVDALGKSQSVASISPERLRQTLKNYSEEVQAAAAELLKRAAPDVAERAAQLDAVVAQVPDGNPARGRAWFFSHQAACSACHRIGEEGEKIGPELSKIGQIRGRRDLAEAILFPSASLARGYESFAIATTGGQVHTGLLSRETASAVYLRTTERAEIRVPRDEIEQMVPNPTSIMPQGLDKTLDKTFGPDAVRDLVSYLETLK